MGAVMKCEKLRQEFMEAVLSGPEAVSAETQEHLRSCAACAGELASFAADHGVLDEWQAPEPSPYFTTRLRARLREETLCTAARTGLPGFAVRYWRLPRRC